MGEDPGLDQHCRMDWGGLAAGKLAGAFLEAVLGLWGWLERPPGALRFFPL